MRAKYLAVLTAVCLSLSCPAKAEGLNTLTPKTASGADLRMGTTTERANEPAPPADTGEEEAWCGESEANLPNQEADPQIPSMEPVQMTLEQFLTAMDAESEAYHNLDYGSVFERMKNAINAGESIQLSAVLSMQGLTVPDNMMFDLSGCGLTGQMDASLLNLEYADMVTGMNKEAEALDLSAQSQGSVYLFQQEYGSLADSLKAGGYQIPEDFSMEAMTKSQNQEIRKAYKKAYQTNDFKHIRNSIDVSGIFAKANKGVSPAVLDTTDVEVKDRANQSAYEKQKNKLKADSANHLYGENGYTAKKKEQKKEVADSLKDKAANEMYEKYDKLFLDD